MRFIKLALASVVLGGSLLLAACGSSDSTSTPVTPSTAAANTTIAIDTATGAQAVGSVLNKTFTFAGGVPSYGTTSTTTQVFTGTGASPTSAIVAGGSTATGPMAYGSCILRFTSSNFTSGPLVLAATVTVNPCSIVVNTAGVPADGLPHDVLAFLVLNGTTSAGISVVVSITPAGVLTVNGVVIGAIRLIAPTGATGSSS